MEKNAGNLEGKKLFYSLFFIALSCQKPFKDILQQILPPNPSTVQKYQMSPLPHSLTPSFDMLEDTGSDS